MSDPIDVEDPTMESVAELQEVIGRFRTAILREAAQLEGRGAYYLTVFDLQDMLNRIAGELTGIG